MKKLLTILATIIMCVVCALSISGCGEKDIVKLKVFAPDGAPALSLAGISQTDADKYFDVSIVQADSINAYVSGNMQADIAIMPVNAAVKLLGSGEKYKLLGTVTHGNLYLMKKGSGADIISVSDLYSLVGKTVGVINLANVPGLTFKIILNDNGLEYNELKDGAIIDSDKVNLKSVTAQEVNPSSDCDYFVVPEPAATTKVNATEGIVSVAGDLQVLYGGVDGYPQAVAVAKTSVISQNSEAIAAFISSFAYTESWLMDENTSASEIVSAIDKMTKGDLSHTFTAENLTKEVIANCGIRYEGNSNGKPAVVEFIRKLNAITNDAWGTPEDAFFH